MSKVMVGERTSNSARQSMSWSDPSKFRAWAEQAISSGTSKDHTGKPLVGVEFDPDSNNLNATYFYATKAFHYVGKSATGGEVYTKAAWGSIMPAIKQRRDGKWWVVNSEDDENLINRPFDTDGLARQALRQYNQDHKDEIGRR